MNKKNNILKIVYNNISENNQLIPAHGFAAWIEFNGYKIMFDTGGDSFVLMNNLAKMSIDFSALQSIVISHNHWDHVYGLPGILKTVKNKFLVYLPKDSNKEISQQCPSMSSVEVTGVKEIHPGIWIVGSIPAVYKNDSFYEQVLVLINNDEITIIVGCSHPGIVKIVESVSRLFPGKVFTNVIGGFHLPELKEKEVKVISDELKKLGVKNISPSHCTGKIAMEVFRKEWGTNFIQLYLGNEYEL